MAQGFVKVRESGAARFGPFAFDLDNRLLYRDGVELWLPPRAVGVLACLLARAGHIVSKQELLDEVWKDSNVTETSLTEAISLLRQTLRDDPQRPTFIQTIPRRGYRFVALQTAGAAGSMPTPTSAPGLAATPTPDDAAGTAVEGAGSVWPVWLSWVLCAVCLGALLIVSITVSRQPSLRVRPIVRFAMDLPAGLALDLTAPVALTRDGQRIAFAATRGDGTRQLFVRDLDQLEPAALADTVGATAPFFSPDGRWVGFFADGKLKKVGLAAAAVEASDPGATRRAGGGPGPSIAGEHVITLCDAPHSFGATWTDANTIVFAASWSAGLQRVSADGGAPATLTTPDAATGEVRHAWPDLVPESNAVVFAGLPPAGAPEAARVAVVSLNTGEVRTLIEAATFPRFLATGHLLFARDHAIFAAPVDASTFELLGPTVPVLDNVRIDARTGAAHFAVAQAGSLAFTPADDGDAADAFRWLERSDTFLLPFPSRAIRAFSVSPDAARVVAAVGDEHRSDIWLQDLAAGKTTRLTSSGQNIEPMWSTAAPTAIAGQASLPSRIIFSARREVGPFNLYFKDLTLPSATATRLTDSPHNQVPCSIAGAGLVYVDYAPETGADLWLLPSNSAPPRPLVKTPNDEMCGVFSEDGRWLAYQTFLRGAWTLMVRASDADAVPMPLAQTDGGRIAWAGSDDLYFTRDDRLLTMKLSRPEDAPRPVASVRGPNSFAPTSPSREERLLLLTASTSSSRSHVEMVLEWARELSARVPVRTPPPKPLR